MAVVASVGLVVALAALLGRVGADSRWLAALGHTIAVSGSIPHGVPFAAAPTAHWANPLVLAELILAGFYRALGDRGLMVAQLLAVAAALWVLVGDARASGASARGSAIAIAIAGLGALPSLAIARVQMFSLVLFALLVALLRSEARRPSQRVWLAVPLLALWGNLHGAAILGLGVLGVYLLVARARVQPRVACGVAVASVLAMFLNPALLGTVGYYHGVLTNVAAIRGEGMWGPVSLSAPFDVVMIACVGALVWFGFRARRWAVLSVWEWIVVLGLGVMTGSAHRNGVWLLFFVVAAGAVGLSRAWPELVRLPAAGAIAVGSVVLVCLAVSRGPVAYAPGPSLVAQAITLSHGSPILAGGGVDEQVAVAGGRIWVGNPIDAFSVTDQSAYLDWLSGDRGGLRALAGVRVVLANRGSPAARLTAADPAFAAVGRDREGVLFERVGG